jgi:hypothetical protein
MENQLTFRERRPNVRFGSEADIGSVYLLPRS